MVTRPAHADVRQGALSIWPFTRNNDANNVAKDIRRLLSLYEQLLQDCVQRLADAFPAMVSGKGDGTPISEAAQTILYDDHPAVRRFVNHYVSSRRGHGERFREGIRRFLIPAWKEDAEKRKESVNRMTLFTIELRLTALLMLTRECPEMEELYDYMSTVARSDGPTECP